LQRTPGVVGEGTQDFPLVNVIVNHVAQLRQIVIIPEITRAFVRRTALGGAAIAPVKGDMLRVPRHLADVDITGKLLK